MKPQLQVEVANVAEILAKHDTQARAKMVAKHAEFEDRRIRESPTKGRRDVSLNITCLKIKLIVV